METPDGVRELPIVGGHLALDFANTVDDPHGARRFDHIADYPALLSWSVRVGSLSPGAADVLSQAAGEQAAGEWASGKRASGKRAAGEQPGGERVIQRARTLRDALNRTLGAIADGTDPGGSWPELRPFVVAALAHADLSPGPVLSWRFTELESPLWPVAAAGFDLLTGPDVARLKRCAGCPWLFLDRSKNGSRRWCSMQDCGTHEKIQRYVSRRAAHRRDNEAGYSG